MAETPGTNNLGRIFGGDSDCSLALVTPIELVNSIVIGGSYMNRAYRHNSESQSGLFKTQMGFSIENLGFCYFVERIEAVEETEMARENGHLY